MNDETKIVVAGRHPERHDGIVNPPVIRTSTVLSKSIKEWEEKKAARAADVPGTYYGRHGTATTIALEEAVAALEGGYRSMLYPSGLSACISAILAVVGSGDHILITDNVYEPVRRLTRGFLKKIGVSATFFDPGIGSDIDTLIRNNTRAVYLESPGSHTFEIQDVAAISSAARTRDVKVLMDNTWATPLYFKPLSMGVDLSIQAGTKYIVGHSDAMLGIVTANRETWPSLRSVTHDLGLTAGPDDAYLGQRGFRTLHVRLKRHWENGLRLADWLAGRPEIERVIHPALPGDPGYALWRRDFTGASGLFAAVLKPVSRTAFHSFVDNLELFHIGGSWGGYESLILPISPASNRSVTTWSYKGPAIRLHAGLENADDLIADLGAGMKRLGGNG